MKASRILPRLVINCFGAVALWSMSMLLVPVAGAQNSSVLPRINQPVNESSLSTLRGNVSSLVRHEYDRGEAAPSTQLTHVRLVLSRSPEQEAALEELMQQQLEKSSPNYHKWLTPDQLGKLYGPADSDISAIVGWLESHELHVDPVSLARTNISFSGSVNQIEEALHVAIHSYERDGQQFYANTSEPAIPSALTSVVRGFAHLNTYKPRPYNVPGSLGMLDRQSNRLTPAEDMSARPELTTGTAPNYSLYLVPGDAATIYDTPNSFNANFSSGAGYTGSGVTIGIGGDAVIQPSTVANYRTLFLGNSTAPTVTNVSSDPATSTKDTDEAYLDTEISGGIAPGATIHFYTAASLDVAIEQMLTDNSVDIFSLSFGACEAVFSTSDNALINSWWQQAAVQGISVTVSTGDSGSASCDNPNTEGAAVGGLAVSGMAATPYNIAVGGTDFYGLLGNFTAYAGTTNSPTTFYRTALKYIPESTWNDSTSVDTTISADVPYVSASKTTNIWAGSGGASSCSTNTVNAQNQETCVSGYPKPSWQTGIGVPNDGVRDIPDVSLSAGSYAPWLVCTDDTGTVNNTTVTANCTTQSSGNFYFLGIGGTSASAPAFAGILALVQQKTGSRLGMDASKTLYDLYNGSNASAIFHDITVGNNSVYCTSGTPNCSTNTAGNTFLTGYNTGTGYDLATGLGSVDASQLINYWSGATGTGAATVTVSPASTTVTVAQPLSVPVTVTGSGTLGTPTGTVTLTTTGYTSQPGTLANGAFTFTIPAGSLPAGTDKLTVAYSGDVNYSTTSGSSAVIVNLLTATVSATASPNNITSAQGTTVTVTVAGTSGTPTGTVTLTSGSYSSGAKSLSSGSVSFSISAGALAVGTDTVTASYSGDTTYNAATGTTSVTVTQAALLTPSVTVTPASSSIDSGQTLNVMAAVTGSGPTPTGSVTLSGGGYTSSAQTLASGSYTFAIPANSLTAGSVTLTVNYGGDASYATGSGSATLTVTQSAFALAATTPGAVSPGGTATSTISLTSSTAYAGTVALTCALTSSPAGASNLPNCSPASSGSTITVTAGTAGGTVTMNVTTTPSSSSAMTKPRIGGWAEAGSGAVLALLVFFGIPARRRGWRVMLGAVALMLALGSFGACGGGSSSGGGNGGSGGGNPGTTAGNYTFTVTGTGNDPAKTTQTATFTVTVN